VGAYDYFAPPFGRQLRDEVERHGGCTFRFFNRLTQSLRPEYAEANPEEASWFHGGGGMQPLSCQEMQDEVCCGCCARMRRPPASVP
jgi:hypothetical protein